MIGQSLRALGRINGQDTPAKVGQALLDAAMEGHSERLVVVSQRIDQTERGLETKCTLCGVMFPMQVRKVAPLESRNQARCSKCRKVKVES